MRRAQALSGLWSVIKLQQGCVWSVQSRGLSTAAAACTSDAAPSWDPSKKRISTPLSEPLPDLQIVKGSNAKLSHAPATQITTLPNGIRIASERSTGPITSLGIYINTGSIYEDTSSSALLERHAFKSTRNRSGTRVFQEIEKLATNVSAQASREQMMYSIDCLKTAVPEALEVLCDSVLNPVFEAEEIEDQKQRLQMLLGNKDVQVGMLTEALAQTAYDGALRRPLLPEASALAELKPEAVTAFFASQYTAPRIVLSAANYEHEQLVALATPMLAGMASGPVPSEPTSRYVGGHYYLPGSNAQAHLLLAFEYKGGWRDSRGAAVMTVLGQLMGAGASFSSGGPGKGMHSRLYTRVLNQYAWVHMCGAITNAFNNTGLVGVQAQCEPQYAKEMLNVMCHELGLLARSVSEVELSRAKRSTISMIYTALESKMASAEDIGRQMLTYGYRISDREYVEMINSITPQDISNFVRKLLASKPTLAVHGDNTDSLNYEALARNYG